MQKCTQDRNNQKICLLQKTGFEKRRYKRCYGMDKAFLHMPLSGSQFVRTGSVQHCRVSNGDHLNRKRRASRGRIALLSLLPCLPVIPVLHSPSLHQMDPSEQPPGGFLREKTEGVYFELVGWSMSASIFDSILCALCLMETWQSGKKG